MTGRILAFALPEKINGMPSLPSANQVTRWNFSGQRWRFVQLKKGYATAILAARVEHRLAHSAPWGPPMDKARLSIVRISARPLDQDNLIAGAKALIDTLVRQGIIRADDPSCLLSIAVSQVRAVVKKGATRPRRGVDVSVEEVIEAATPPAPGTSLRTGSRPPQPEGRP